MLKDMTKHQELKSGIMEAMKAKDAVRLSVLRGLITACTNEVVAKGKKPDELLSDEEVMTIVGRLAKQRKDSIDQFAKGGRQDLVDTEAAELKVLEALLPPQMSREEIEAVVRAKIAELGVTDKSGAGKLTGALMKDLRGKADGGEVKAVVDSLLQ
jgi:uncharacterized protein